MKKMREKTIGLWHPVSSLAAPRSEKAQAASLVEMPIACALL